MAAKEKVQKQKTPKKKIIRKTPNINLLKHLNALLLVSGFLVSLLTIGFLSLHNERYDIRSRGQEYPTVTPTITPSPGLVTPTIFNEEQNN